ncbi:hypothetical protein [Sulfuricurvum sp.]|uniref:hypothetical protein n=1 Tax=Sulfuricurvum sp. TaxID=2025608 RepID=UPI002E36F429|nr:hypothetical protein [Sulfuricurvum sp.]HEX5328868.1 hypothetical protein [Sulfuricurvum sp.]
MEQSKAIEILKKQKNQLELLQSGDWNEFEDDIRELNEAIAELEALQTPKQCKNCYHSTIIDESYSQCPCLYLIDEDGEPTSIVPNEFCCDLHTPEVTQ